MANRNSNSSSSSRTNAEVTYFDMITSGVGYLNRIREVQASKKDAYLCCKINALVGPSDDVEYREIDLIVVGSQAKDAIDVIEEATPHQNAKRIVGFRMGDARPDSYVLQGTDNRGNQRSETRFCLKARLLKITFCRIDGVEIKLPGLEDDEESAVPADEQFDAQQSDEPDHQDEPEREHTPRSNQRSAQQQKRPAQAQSAPPAQRNASTTSRNARVPA